MLNPKLALAGALALALSSCAIPRAHAIDNGQFENVEPKIREWFKSVKSPKGHLCCDMADGHRTTWRGTKEGGYEVPIEGEWVSVPPETVIYDARNPTGDSVVWYVRNGPHAYFIRCFVPGGGA